MEIIVAGIQWILDFICPSASLYGIDANRVLKFTIPVAVLVPFVFFGAILERIRPIENHDTQEARANIHTEWMLVAFMATMRPVLQATMGPVLQILQFIVFGRIAAAIGGPLLYLEPQSVLGSVALVVVYALYIDCAKYWMHRLSHRIPLLWAVHSFHHSAESVTVATGVRHHWAERITLIPFWFLTVTLFQVPEHLMAMAVLLMKAPDLLAHLNYKIAWRMASRRPVGQHASVAPDSPLGRAGTLRQELLRSLSDHGRDIRDGLSPSARRVPGNWPGHP
jgi:sterol desaturase/sphingolipid hydroxylase (fatty acid hydroxylase superfamily)